jgi:hypothetical protein
MANGKTCLKNLPDLIAQTALVSNRSPSHRAGFLFALAPDLALNPVLVPLVKPTDPSKEQEQD